MTELLQEDCGKSIDNITNLKSIEKASILVTGGTGFVGKWLTEMIIYLNENCDFKINIYLLSRNEFSDNLKNTYNYIHFIKSDIKNLKQLPIDIDYIIHTAGSPDSREHVSSPIKTIETFYRGTQTILDLATRLPRIKKIIHFSSNKVYGDNFNEVKITEETKNYNSFNGYNIYSESKRISEALCYSYISEFRLPITIVRPFAFVGPFQYLDKPWAINNFIRDAILGEPIRILGNPNNVKSYLYGSDLANYILNLLVTGSVGEVYNLGSSNPITLVDLAHKIKNIVNIDIEIQFKSSKDSYLENIYDVPSVSKIELDINVNEKFNIDLALKRTIMWNKIESIKRV